MASIRKENGRNGYRVSFYGLDKRKRSIWLGGFSKRQAETVKSHVEQLLSAKGAGVAPDVHTARWLGDISAELRGKLLKADLIEPSAEDRGPATLGPFLDEYVELRRDVKESTRTQYRQVIKSLVDFFSVDRRLDAISTADAERWRIHVRTKGNRRDPDLDGWADNTIRRTTGRARQFFSLAVKEKLIAENPFDGFAVAVHGNTKRQRFVTHESILKALDVCSCPELRVVIALSRFGGIRIPSEVLRLTWVDVNLEAGRLTVVAPKTEHYEDGGMRFVPIFPELRPYLQELHDKVQPGLDCPMSTPLITRWNSGTQNLRTEFQRVLSQAGINPWPKLFHNLRASRQTELLAEFPAKDVCDWLGNSHAVAMRHYAMATTESFERAVRGRPREKGCGSTGGSISVDQEPSGEGDPSQEPPKNAEMVATDALRGAVELPGQDSNWWHINPEKQWKHGQRRNGRCRIRCS